MDDPGSIGNKAPGDGGLKVTDFDYTNTGKSKAIQLGAKMSFFPDATVIPNVTSNGSINPSATTYGPGGVEVRNPVIELQLYVGDLGPTTCVPPDANPPDPAHRAPYYSHGL